MLELRGVTLPTSRCLPVLDALSAGDRSRQRTVGVDAHLGDCAKRLDFVARLVANTPETAATAGVDQSGHLELLVRHGVHLQVGPDALTLR